MSTDNTPNTIRNPFEQLTRMGMARENVLQWKNHKASYQLGVLIQVSQAEEPDESNMIDGSKMRELTGGESFHARDLFR